jgi:hypothetical protein
MPESNPATDQQDPNDDNNNNQTQDSKKKRTGPKRRKVTHGKTLKIYINLKKHSN